MNDAVVSADANFITTFVASFLLWIMYAGLIYFWIAGKRIKRDVVIKALMASLIAWVLAQIAKDIFPTIRPFRINGYPPLTLTIPKDNSFPSAHAALAFALAFSIWLKNKSIGFAYLVLSLLVSWGRIISNVHFPIDVLGGAVLGLFTSLLMDTVNIKTHK
jgi:undecaprenyl-diphosphatase